MKLLDKMCKYKTMLSYCLKCKKKKTENINPRVPKASNNKTMLLSKCSLCGTKKQKFIKKQELSRTLSSLCLKIPLSKIPLF